MSQVITARLSRNDAQPWGFRLQGGKDFGTPLVIQKVNTGSIADQAGLKAGDAVVSINQQELYNLRHKDAQDAIVKAGPAFELVIQRGGATWKPAVTPIGSAAPSPVPGNYTPVTKTSLAANKQQIPASPVRSIANKQYNTPVAMYSDESIAESLSSQTEVLAGGVLGVNFKKNEKVYNPENSEVLKALQENDSEPEPAELLSAPYQAPQQHHHQQQQHQQQQQFHQQQQQQQYQAPQQQYQAPQQQQPVQQPGAPQQQVVTKHVHAPIDRPITNNGGLPAGQNICADCERLIVGVFVRIKDKNLHVECFKCATCGTSLKNQGYFNLHNKLYCDIHARMAAMASPPPNSNGLTPVTFPPKNVGASTISSALNAHAGNLNGNCHNNESEILKSTLKSKVNDDNNNIIYDNRSTSSETDCSSLSSSDKENDSRPSSSLYGNINKCHEAPRKASGDNFQFRTMNGGIIRSVIAPGKGIKVDYKAPSNFSAPKPFSYTQAAPSVPQAAPKSPSSYPPPAQQAWAPTAQPAWAPPSAAPQVAVAPKPAGPAQEFCDFESCCEKPREKKVEIYVPSDSEEEFDPKDLVDIAKPPLSNFIWPPPSEEQKVPIAAPLYVAPPETQRFTAKPCVYRPLQKPQRLSVQNVQKAESQQTNSTEYECLNVESNITATTSTSNASSESDYKMYQTQNNHYANMFEQTVEVDDEVEEINQSTIIDLRRTPPPIELPKNIKRVEFVEPEPDYKPETFSNVFSSRKETWQKLTAGSFTSKREDNIQLLVEASDDNPNNSEDDQNNEEQQQEQIEEDDEENDVEAEIMGQHVGHYDGSFYQLAPSNIPQPTPKGYQSDFQKALITTCDRPYQITDIGPTPEPRLPYLDLYEEAIKTMKYEPEEAKEKTEAPEFKIRTTTKQCDFPLKDSEVRSGNTLMSSMMRTASPKPMEFVKSNIIEEVHLPDEIDAYFPPPMSMLPHEPYGSNDPYRTKSPFVGALTTVPDRPYTPFGREIMSQLTMELPKDSKTVTFSNALHTAPDDSFDPSSLEYEYDPVEYSAKVYERIAEEIDHVDEESPASFIKIDGSTAARTYNPAMQPWSTASDQIGENSYTDSMSGHESLECQVSESRRCSEFQGESRRCSEYQVSDRRRSSVAQQSGCDSRRCSQQNCCDSRRCSEVPQKQLSDLLKTKVREEDEFDPDKPNPNAIYPRRQQPSPFEGMQVKVTNKMTSSLHKPDEIPTYQRKWFNLPTQNPPRTPEPEELRDNCPAAFHDWPISASGSGADQNAVQVAVAAIQHRASLVEKPPIPTQAAEPPVGGVLLLRRTSGNDQNQRRSEVVKEEDEDADEFEEIAFPTVKIAQTQGAFPTRGVRKNSLLDLPERQKVLFQKQRDLRQELAQQQTKMQSKQKARQAKELEMMQRTTYENPLDENQRSCDEFIREEIRENEKLTPYEQEMEYKRQLELEREQRQREKELKEQQARETEYQKELEAHRLHGIKQREKREREMQVQNQREMEYQKIREEKEEAARIVQEQHDLEMRRQQEEMEREIRKQQEHERRDAEIAESKRLWEARHKEERDRELAKIEAQLKEKRESELRQLEQEIREKREENARAVKAAEQKIKEDQKAREEAEKYQKKIEEFEAKEQRERELKLQQELKMRQKQESDRKQREEMELFNIEEERRQMEAMWMQEAVRAETSSRASNSRADASSRTSYTTQSYQQQTVWPAPKPPTPALLQTPRPMPIPIIRTDSETELNADRFRFEPLDEEQKRTMAAIRPPSTCYSPPTEDKPFPSIPYYQQHLAFFEAEPEHCGLFNPKGVSPGPNRSRSPAFGPPPNPLRAFSFEGKTRDPELDESGIYLCGERLMSPVWYDKQHKQVPVGVQRKIHAGGPPAGSARPPSKPDLQSLNEAVRKHKQEAGTKPPPPPPPMPPQKPPTRKMVLDYTPEEPIVTATDMPPKASNKDNLKATNLLLESVERLNINTQNSEFRKNASSVIAAMLESRLTKQQQKPFVAKKFVEPELPPPPPPKFSPMINEFTSCDQDLPLPPPPSPLKIPASILTPPLSSDENDQPQKLSEIVNGNEKVNYRNKKNLSNGHNNQSSDLRNAPSRFSINKPELSTHARDRRSYIEKNNNEVSMNGATATTVAVVEDNELDVTKIANGLANGQHPVCDKCKCKITRGPFITALGKTWCPAHFLCVNPSCKRELVDIGFVEEKGDLYCEYCFEQFLAPPCSKCNGKVKGDCLNAIGKKFHPECFKCTYCGKLFGNSPFFLEEGDAYCEADWNELFTTKCFACGFPVEAGDRWVEALNNNYHSQCFNCTYCKKNLEGQSFFAKGGRPFCKNHAR